MNTKLWLMATVLGTGYVFGANAQQSNEQYYQEQQQQQQQAHDAEQARQGYQNQVDSQQNQMPLPPPQPNGEWKESFGAIASDDDKGILGGVTDQLTRAVATDSALQTCKEKGGTNCRSVFWYANSCAVMVLGSQKYKIRSAETVDRAAQVGMSECSASNSNCRVFYSACSKPQFVRY